MKGFRTLRERYSAELGGTLREYVHEETGAQIAWLDNGEQNKLFCAAFKTLPEDSTGVFHILEHSVLCGSDKFPVKEPFVELMKSSMNTFLNAMTFQDKTVYPVSSRNSRDFLNLAEVYLDAVFRPAILTNPNIFRQEGHHIEQDENGALSYKGVVYNEMKGALSNVDETVNETLISLIFGGTPYGVNSGGDPDEIPDLTYEKFIETYKKYYHPSNCRIYLDGSIPVEETFGLIASYLDGAGRGEAVPDAGYAVSKAVSGRIRYALAENESPENKNIYAMARIVGTWKDKAKLMAANVLSDVLLGSNDSPLKREILSSGLAQEVFSYIDDSFQQPYLVLECQNVADGKEKELRELILETARKIAAEGIDRELLEASIARNEFSVREQEEPVALRRVIGGLNSWLHDGDPMTYMVFDDDIKKIRGMIAEGGYEALAAELFASEEGLCELLAVPDHGLNAELAEKENARLEKVRASWTEKDYEENRVMNAGLSRWQQEPDSEEAVATIPVLELSEIDREPVIPPTEEKTAGGVKVLYHKVPCHGIVHYSVYFDLSDLTLEELTVVSKAGSYFGILPTEKYDSLSLQKALKKTVGRMTFKIGTSAKAGDSEKCVPYFAVRVSTLDRDFDKSVGLMKEILFATDFSAGDKIKEIVIQNDEYLKQSNIAAGHSLGMLEVLSGYSSAGAAAEAMDGYPYIRYSHAFAADFDAMYGEFTAAFEKLAGHFTKDRMVLSVSSEEYGPELAEKIVSAFGNGDGSYQVVPGGAEYKRDFPAKTGFPIAARIGFACQGYCFGKDGIRYDGSMSVAAKIASLDFLWNTVRVQGGAYGTGLRVSLGNNVTTYSYRDPSPDRSLRVNAEIAPYLVQFADSGRAPDKYIISAISDTEPLVSPRVTGIIADENWFSGIGPDDLRRIRKEMLETDAESIRRFAGIAEKFASDGAECVVAHKDALDKCGGLTVLEI